MGPLIGVNIPLLPFFFEGSALTMSEGGVAGVGLGMGVLAVFGAYMGTNAGHSWYVSAIRMALAVLVVALINLFLPG